MQQTMTASHSVTVQYLSQLPALNANYVNLLVITYWCRLKIKFDLLVTYYRIHNICFLTNFTELELTNVQANYWGPNALWTPNRNFGGAMAPVAAPPMTWQMRALISGKTVPACRVLCVISLAVRPLTHSIPLAAARLKFESFQGKEEKVCCCSVA